MLFAGLVGGLACMAPATATTTGTASAASSAPADATTTTHADAAAGDGVAVSAPRVGASVASVAAAGCLGPDIRCDATDAATDLAGSGVDAVTGAAGDVLGVDFPNPLDGLGNAVSQAAADAWTAAMLALWNAGLFVLKLVLSFADMFLTPDLSENGPGKGVYVYTFWIAASLVIVMAMIELGIAAFKREGKGLARVTIGAAQFVIVWSCWLAYCVAVMAACSGLTKALMEALLGVDTWASWDPMGKIGSDDITDGVVATVLGLLGCVLWLAALCHLLVMLARAASLIVLVATGPIAAAGLVADAGRSWFWKSLRWFHAAAFTPVLMVLVLGIGVQLSTGVAVGLTDDTQKAVGTALPSVMLICISAVAPLALFKLLAFVDPGTPSGASFRQGLAMQGGLQGLLSGGAGGGAGGSSAASETDDHGRSSGEARAESSTNDRFNNSAKSGLSSVGGGIGQALTAGMGMVQQFGGAGTSLIADQTNQEGVGHQTYGPDFSNLRGGGSGSNADRRRGGPQRHPDADDGGQDGDPDVVQNGGQDGAPAMPPTFPIPTTPPVPANVTGGGGGPNGGQGGTPGGAPSGAGTTPGPGGAGGAGSTGGAGGAAGGAAAVPPVAV